MQHIDIRKKRPSMWPWFVGAGILLLILWGTTTLLAPEEEAEPDVAVPTVQDTHPPATIPAPPHVAGTAASFGAGRVGPLGEENVGETLQLTGVVVATGNDSFWLLADATVLRVESRREAHRGDTLTVNGTIQVADPEKTDRMRSVLDRSRGRDQWRVIRPVKLVEQPSGTR